MRIRQLHIRLVSGVVILLAAAGMEAASGAVAYCRDECTRGLGPGNTTCRAGELCVYNGCVDTYINGVYQGYTCDFSCGASPNC